MILSFQDQRKRLTHYLPKFKNLQPIPYVKSDLKEKNTTYSIPCNKDFSELSFDFLFTYNIFPSNILVYTAEWSLSKRQMQKGDTIIQQIYFPPLKGLSSKVITGVRINNTFKENNIVGFSYETLKGHIEKGISTFSISQLTNELAFTIHTYSKANNVILDFFYAIFSSPYQDFCTTQALKNMIKEFKQENNL
ncbi:DUF1990 family protein [Rubrolithibacter danxiaensis]|uniref:DUF1990 family protein n=1 Tax=Rubrolithibacter danxiaensis TaxID=3390805 RepID=UPI003BF77B1E